MSWRGRIEQFNDVVAVTATERIGTMWCVYAFTALVVIPLFVPAVQTSVMYFSSSFLQLIFLPLIMVGNKVMGRTAEQRAAQDHETLMAELAEIKELHAKVDALHDKVEELQKKVGLYGG